MSLSFLNPLILFGLAAGLLPVLIHRLTKRDARLRRFSAVRLLLLSQQVMARPQRLKHLLLLALRILAVLSVVLMMARPVLTDSGFFTQGKEDAGVIVFDNSLSMGYREDGGERFAIAKGAAKEMIEASKGKVIVIPTASNEGQAVPKKEAGLLLPEEALRELDRLSLSFGRGHPAKALDSAYRQLRELKRPGEIRILTDMTRGDWEEFNLSAIAALSGDISITFVRIGGRDRDPNLAVQEARFVGGEAVVGVPLRLEASVSNRSGQSATPLVQLYLSGVKRDQKAMPLKAGEEGKVYFDFSVDKPGWVDGEIRLPGDRLPYDDTFYFTLRVGEKVKVLIVDGDPRTSLRAGESYYFANALRPGQTENSPFTLRIITEPEFGVYDLRPFDTVILLNVARPQASRLASVLESRKPVFIFLGDRVIPEEYHNIALFPWRIREIKDAGARASESIGEIDVNHESLQAFSGPAGESLRKASFNRYFKVEGGKKSLLTLRNGDTLLSEADLGNGKLFLFTSSADLDWNDFPLKAAYLPLVQGLLKEAVGLGKASFPKGVRVGESFGEKALPVQMAGPKGGPGIYQFKLVGPAPDETRRGMNPPPEESDLRKVAPEEMKKKLGTIDMKVVEYKEGLAGSLHGQKKELWPHILAFLLIVLGVEMALANGIPRSNKVVNNQ
jgi:hypothetical protein